jgi:hypothetical protein
MAQERGFGQDLNVDARRSRLKQDRRQLVATVQPTWGVNVPDRDREDEPPGESGRPIRPGLPDATGTTSDDVIAMIDRP